MCLGYQTGKLDKTMFPKASPGFRFPRNNPTNRSVPALITRSPTEGNLRNPCPGPRIPMPRPALDEPDQAAIQGAKGVPKTKLSLAFEAFNS